MGGSHFKTESGQTNKVPWKGKTHACISFKGALGCTVMTPCKLYGRLTTYKSLVVVNTKCSMCLQLISSGGGIIISQWQDVLSIMYRRGTPGIDVFGVTILGVVNTYVSLPEPSRASGVGLLHAGDTLLSTCSLIKWEKKKGIKVMGLAGASGSTIGAGTHDGSGSGEPPGKAHTFHHPGGPGALVSAINWHGSKTHNRLTRNYLHCRPSFIWPCLLIPGLRRL